MTEPRTITVNYKWLEWDKHFTNWHYKQTNPTLSTFFPRISSGVKLEEKKFFIPLCGKAIDLKWLYDQGLTVVGVEAVEKWIYEFFAEHGLEFDVKEHKSYSIFSTKDLKLQIFNGNLFEFDESHFGDKFDYFLDRGSLVAIEVENREAYVECLAKIMKPQSVGLLEVFEFDKKFATHQPYPVSVEEMSKLFGSKFRFEEIKRYIKDYTPSMHRNEQRVSYKIIKKE